MGLILGSVCEGDVSGKSSSNKWKSDTLGALFMSVLKSSWAVNIWAKEEKLTQLLKPNIQKF